MHVIVGMSGGVDSSVAAYLLKKQGYKITGLFMKNWEDDDLEFCSAAKDFEDAKSVCDKLEIPLKSINFSAEYWDFVFENFLSEYKAGRTPNPDILCNKEIKFKTFLDYAIEDLNADFIATGHYVRKKTQNKLDYLLRGIDENKDQSYFLYALNQNQIQKSLFPIGDLEKSEVRKIAENLGLITANKKDSTGICFIGERKFTEFLNHYLPAKPGEIVTENGEIIGEHQGLMYHTIGQRKGLKIGGTKNSNNLPWYVAEKNLEKNELIVVQGENHPTLFSKGCIVQQLNWINQSAPINPLDCTVKTRYRQKDISCTITPISNDKIEVKFHQPVSSVTPGQSAVFYQNEICLGGGIIEKYIK